MSETLVGSSIRISPALFEALQSEVALEALRQEATRAILAETGRLMEITFLASRYRERHLTLGSYTLTWREALMPEGWVTV